jgi:uncharacterized protein (TIGR03083 family)
MTRLSYSRYLELIREDANRLAAAAIDHLDAPVPPCPGWDVREAVRHTGSVFRHKVACMELMRSPEEGEWMKEPAQNEDVLLWFRDSLELLLERLSARGPDDPAFTWWPPEQTAGFWARRMALETVVHRADVESASEPVSAVASDLAVDGIDEVLHIFLGSERFPENGTERLGTVAVSTGGEHWAVSLEPRRATVAGGAPGDPGATLSGDPGALFVYLWGRGAADSLKRDGDVALVDTLRRRLALATQ